MSQQQSKIPELEGLRGLLAWWVVGDHVLGNGGYSPNELSGPLWLLRAGTFAVDVFIILSGFVVVLLLDQQRVSFGTFLIRRFFRLYPIYLLRLGIGAIGVLFSQFTADALPGHFAVVGVAERATATWSHWGRHLVAHLTMLHGAIPNEVLPYSSGAFLDPAWSISLEWQFYLVAPLLFLLATRTRWGFLVLTALVPLFWKVGKEVGTFDFPSFLPMRLHFFWLGAVSYFVFRNFPVFQHLLPSRSILVVTGFLVPVVLILVAAVAPPQFQRASRALVPVAVWIPCLALILPTTAGVAGWLTTYGRLLLNHHLLQVLGNVSYVTYLVHLPIIQLLRWCILNAHPGVGRSELVWAIGLVSVPLTVAASIYLSRWVEKPGIELGRRIARRWSNGTQPHTPKA